MRARQTKHGRTDTSEHRIWCEMRHRCTNPRHKQFADYGGRGISVSDEWLNSFDQFFADMGERPEGKSLERKDNNGPYSKDNCCWATSVEQGRNKRSNRIVTFKGESLPLVTHCENNNKDYLTVFARLSQLGWTAERAISTPTNRPYKKQPTTKRKRTMNQNQPQASAQVHQW